MKNDADNLTNELQTIAENARKTFGGLSNDRSTGDRVRIASGASGNVSII